MTPRPDLGAIVLAGGRSSRFGRDKLAERVDGRPLLDHAVDAVLQMADDVVVVTAPDGDPVVPAGVRVTRDAAPFEGPLAGLLVGLEATRRPIVVVVGGDMPGLVPAVLAALADALADPAVDAAALEFAGRRQQVPIVLRRDPAREAIRRCVADGERQLGVALDGLAVRLLAPEEWQALDPSAASLRDVDRPEDLGPA
jgi:molybdopterin-guanine dinucleotide biosynthesis protein A